MRDLIFWYTGWIVWAAFAFALFIAVLIAVVSAVPELYRGVRAWKAIRRLLGIPHGTDEEFWRASRALRTAADKVGLKYESGEQIIEWLREFHKAYDASAGTKREWYE